MIIRTNFLPIMLASFLIFGGCSKDVEEYNKPAVYWYGKIIASISNGDLEKADDYYSSLQGEHIGSPLLPEATLILSIAHMQYEEYILSEHFSNEYVKRYANSNEKEFAEFMKIKAKYLALPNPRRDQKLIKEALTEGEAFKLNYPNSMYYPVVDSMLTNLRMAEAALNEMIIDLYERLDKPRSADYYRKIKPQTWMKWDEIDRANTAWYREWFEGDGTESWYGFMIPDIQSVVSRNTIQEEYIPQEQEDIVDSEEKIEESIVEEKRENTAPLSEKQEAELQKAQELKDKGVLSEEEYKAFEEEILNSGEEPYFKSKDITQKTSQQDKELKKAQNLFDDGILSEEEFKNLKEEILGN